MKERKPSLIVQAGELNLVCGMMGSCLVCSLPVLFSTDEINVYGINSDR